MKTGMAGDGSRDEGAGGKEQGLGGKGQGGGGKEQGLGSKGQGRGKSGDTFENLAVWRDGVELAASVYEAFRGCTDYGFRDQIRRAAVSVSSNIAEGYERDSNVEFIRYLFIAKASCGEARSQAYVARRVGLLGEQSGFALIEQARLLSRRLQKLIDVRREKFN